MQNFVLRDRKPFPRGNDLDILNAFRTGNNQIIIVVGARQIIGHATANEAVLTRFRREQQIDPSPRVDRVDGHEGVTVGAIVDDHIVTDVEITVEMVGTTMPATAKHISVAVATVLEYLRNISVTFLSMILRSISYRS
jgi:uncharacterized alkaline shock family protein YloU